MDRIAPTRRPKGPPDGFHCWRTLLFLHWEVPAEEIQKLISPHLTVDTFDGRAFVGLVPFTMHDIRPTRHLPPIPGVSAFHETNVRTYVHHKGKDPGVWFFSLDAANALAVTAARVGWHLPYFWADMTLDQEGDQIHYTTRRRYPEPTPAELTVDWTIGPSLGTAAPDTLEHFLCERYFLYSTDRYGDLFRGQVHHPPYPLHSAVVDHMKQSMLKAAGFPVPGPPDLPAYYSPGVDVEVFELLRVLFCPPMTPFSETLLALLPPPSAVEAEYPPAFGRMAELLLNGATLRVAGVPHRFTEIEFYVNGLGHKDTFTHGDPMQKKGGFWYFHRTGGQYRSGTYKGLDIAIGNEQLFGGILIRGVEQLEPLPRLLDGPCVCVDHMLALNGAPSIEQLVARFDVRIDAPASGESPLFLEAAAEPRKQPIFSCPRVGLTLKRSASEERQKFLARSYRFLSEPRAIKKGKPNLVAALHREGKSLAQIVTLSGAPKASVARYIAAFEAGKSKPAEQLRDDLSSEQLCELFGACDRHLG